MLPRFHTLRLVVNVLVMLTLCFGTQISLWALPVEKCACFGLVVCQSHIHIGTSLTVMPGTGEKSAALLQGVTLFVPIPSKEAISGTVSNSRGETKVVYPT